MLRINAFAEGLERVKDVVGLGRGASIDFDLKGVSRVGQSEASGHPTQLTASRVRLLDRLRD